MIVISNPTPIINEMEIIHSLFEEGLDLLHIRKPNYSEEEIKVFLSKIKIDHRSKLVLHDDYNWAAEFEIYRFHKSVEISNKDQVIISKKLTFSTSTHSIEEFNQLSVDFDYAFLSPVFPSISKENYYSKTNLLETVMQRTNYNTKLVALGGIQPEKLQLVFAAGFDAIALLGCIWQQNNPLKNFKLCQQIVHSY